MLKEYGMEVVDKIEDMSLDTMKPRIAKATARLMREIFNEDVQGAEYFVSQETKEAVKQSIENTRLGRANVNEYEFTKADDEHMLRNHLIMLWADSNNSKMEDEVHFAEGVDVIWGDLEDVGYSEEDVMRFLSYFLEE